MGRGGAGQQARTPGWEQGPAPQAAYLIVLCFSLHCCSSLRTLCFSPLITCRGTTPVKLTEGDHTLASRAAASPTPPCRPGGGVPCPLPGSVCTASRQGAFLPSCTLHRSPASLLVSKQGGRGAGDRCSLHRGTPHRLSHQARTPQAQRPRAAPPPARVLRQLDWGPGEASPPQRFLPSAHTALWEMTPCAPERTCLSF